MVNKMPILFHRTALVLATVFIGFNLLSMGFAQDSTTSDTEDTWPQWRGPDRDGFVASTMSWPDTINEDNFKQVWRVEMGPSYSGPIVVKDRVYVTETEDAKDEVVRALDRKTGKELWQARWKGSMQVPFFAWSNGSWIRATPAFDGETLYVAGMRDVLVALDAKTGSERWKVDFVGNYGTPLPTFGFVSSPLVLGDYIYVQAGAAFRKLDKRTGKLIWTTLSDGGSMYGSAFSSPYVATIAGKKQVLVQTRQKLAGVDMENGNVLWSEDIEAFRGMNILTPVVHNDSVFTTSYGGMMQLLKISKDDDAFTVDIEWDNATEGYMSSPVIIDGHIYLHLKSQRFTCIDLATGERKWTTTPQGKYWSLVANKDRILALNERGELFLIRANPEKYDLIDKITVSEDSTWAHLAVCGQDVFVRELNAISAYKWGDAK